MKSRNLVKFAPAVVLLLAVMPMVAFAELSAITTLVDQFGTIVTKLIPILTGLAVVYFIIGLIRFVIAGDEEKRKEGKSMMWWGLVAIFVIVSLWGIISFAQTTLDIDDNASGGTPPKIQGLSSSRSTN
jgi:uncharacterized membrane protein YuzA (DUF378 family)